MPVRTVHDQLPNSIYFVTFTCYKWLPLFEKTRAYDTIYKWFDALHQRKINVIGYVIMPNHVHVMLHFPEMLKSLNNVVSNSKRFIAYEIIKRLTATHESSLLDRLHAGVTKTEQKKGQIHKVFEDSFEAKECFTAEFIFQKLNYIHHNPVRGKWSLVEDFADYAHSSASFYEKGIKSYDKIIHINEVLQ